MRRLLAWLDRRIDARIAEARNIYDPHLDPIADVVTEAFVEALVAFERSCATEGSGPFKILVRALGEDPAAAEARDREAIDAWAVRAQVRIRTLRSAIRAAGLAPSGIREGGRR